MQSNEEKILLSKICNGDKNAFWKLWKMYEHELKKICLQWMNGSLYDAEDVVSNAMLRANEKIYKYARNISNFKGWIIRLTRNVCIDYFREQNKYTSLADPTLQYSYTFNAHEEETKKESPEEKYIRHETSMEIQEAITHLPKHFQEIFILRSAYSMSYQEIAAKLHLTTDNVRKRFQKAKDMLKKEIYENTSILSDISLDKILTWNIFTKALQYPEQTSFCHSKKIREITPNVIATGCTTINLATGIEKDVFIFLKLKPYKLNIKADTLQKYLQRHSNGWKKHLEFAEILYAMGKWSKTIEELRFCLHKQPRIIDIYLRLAYVLYKLNLLDEALKIYSNALLHARKESTRFHILGRSYLCCKEYKKASESFYKAITLERDNEVHFQMLGLSFFKIERYDKALDAFQKTLTYNNKNLVALHYTFKCFLQYDRVQKAEQVLERILKIYPSDIQALKHTVCIRCFKGLLHGKEGKKTWAILRRLKKLAPKKLATYKALAVYFTFQDKQEKAQQLLWDISQTQKNCPQFWHFLSMLLFHSGSSQQSIVTIIKAHNLDYLNKHILKTFCNILTNKVMREKLHPVLDIMLSHYSDQWSIYTTAAQAILTCFHDIERAYTLSQKSIEMQPDLPQSYFKHAQILFTTGKYEEALDVLQKGLQLLPHDDSCRNSVASTFIMAKCYEKLGKPSLKKDWLHNSLQRTDMLRKYYQTEGYFWQGKILHELGRSHDAAVAFRHCCPAHLPFNFKIEL